MRQLLKVGLTFFLVSCTNVNQHTVPEPLALKTPLKFNVATIELIAAVEPEWETRYGKRFPLPALSAALENWSRHTFINGGQEGTLFVTVEQASIKESSIPKKHHGLKGVFTYDPSEKYEGHIALRLELHDKKGFAKESTLTTVSHSITVLENITPEKREKKIKELIHALIHELDQYLRANVEDNLSNYILP